ncbi:MAG: SDR family NAD(P)-dependent oxidoreductase [Halobacteriaceae archaeon]
MQADRHDGKTVVVTGASSGIGRGIALRFAEEGATVVNADVQRAPRQGEWYDTDVTTPVDEVIEEMGGEAAFVETDVSDPAECEALIEHVVDEYGQLDVLVNNAGIYFAGDSQSISVEQWDQLIGVDLDGVFYCSKFAVPHLKETTGNVVNIASVHATEGGGGPPYASAKAGVRNLTRDLAVELGPDRVRVNAICPGFVETPIQDYMDEDDIDASRENTPLPYFGVPEDIGDAAVFLADDDEARFVTGAALYVDGGWSSRRA